MTTPKFPSQSKPRLLMTGASGFIGRALLQRAASAGWEVAAMVRAEQADALLALHPGLTAIEGRMDAPPWSSIERFGPTAVFHGAWIATPGVFWTSPENQLHLEWSTRFCTRLLDLGIDRALVLGTSAEYRWGGGPLTETAEIAPSSLYAECKHQLHTRLRESFARRGVRLSWCRVFYPYGVGEPRQKLCSAMALALLRGGSVELRTPWSEKDYIHVRDLARATELVLDHGYDGAVNLGTGRGVRVVELVRTIARAAGLDQSVVTAHPDAASASDHAVADVGVLRGLGFEPEVTLDAGIQELVDSLRRGADPA